MPRRSPRTAGPRPYGRHPGVHGRSAGRRPRGPFRHHLHRADYAGDIRFPVIQTCQDGEIAWIEIPAEGAAEPENPAPTIKVTEGPPTAAELDPGTREGSTTRAQRWRPIGCQWRPTPVCSGHRPGATVLATADRLEQHGHDRRSWCDIGAVIVLVGGGMTAGPTQQGHAPELSTGSNDRISTDRFAKSDRHCDTISRRWPTICQLRALVDAAREGDDVAVRELGAPHAAGDLAAVQRSRFARRRGRPRPGDVLCARSARCRQYRGDAPIHAWLLSIARRVCADHVRGRVRQRRLLSALTDSAEDEWVPAPGNPTWGLLDGIEADRREAFVLTQVAGPVVRRGGSGARLSYGHDPVTRVARARVELADEVAAADAC